MKLRTFRYLIKEGIKNTLRNKLMFLASTITVTAALLILGIFILVGANVNMIGQKVEEGLVVNVYLDIGIKQEKIDELRKKLTELNVGKVQFVSSEQAYKQIMKMDMIKGHEKLLAGYEEKKNFLPPAFTVSLHDAKEAETTVNMIKKIPGIVPTEVKYNKEIIEKLVKVMNVIRIVSFAVLVLLSAISILIISNTVKLTVFARRKEIGIMKYIGATDFFINLPFLAESLLIGVASSFIALIIIFQGYEILVAYLKVKSLVINMGVDSFISFSSMASKLLVLYLFIGVGMGCIGSFISMRKYLKV